MKGKQISVLMDRYKQKALHDKSLGWMLDKSWGLISYTNGYINDPFCINDLVGIEIVINEGIPTAHKHFCAKWSVGYITEETNTTNANMYNSPPIPSTEGQKLMTLMPGIELIKILMLMLGFELITPSLAPLGGPALQNRS